MRIYLDKKQTEPVGDKGSERRYGAGFYPDGRVPAELAQQWLDDGIACPATDDNVAQWPEPTPTEDEIELPPAGESGLYMVDGEDPVHKAMSMAEEVIGEEDSDGS